MDRNSWALPTADAANRHNNVVQTANLVRGISPLLRESRLDGILLRIDLTSVDN